MILSVCSVGDTVIIPFTKYFYCCIVLDRCLVQHVNGNIEQLIDYRVRKISENRFLEIEGKDYMEKKLSKVEFQDDYNSAED